MLHHHHGFSKVISKKPCWNTSKRRQGLLWVPSWYGVPYDPVSHPPGGPSGGASTKRTGRSLQQSDEDNGKKQGEKQVILEVGNLIVASKYGIYCYLRFPGYKFCQNCALYDNAVQANKLLHYLSSKDFPHSTYSGLSTPAGASWHRR